MTSMTTTYKSWHIVNKMDDEDEDEDECLISVERICVEPFAMAKRWRSESMSLLRYSSTFS